MEKLSRSNLWSLEEYAARREAFRTEVMAHKAPRRVALGQHANLYFEDFTTMKYQVQEMLRAERIFEPDGIEEELGAYNPLIPDGRNLKATFMIEHEDVEERRRALARLVGVEDRVWLCVEGFDRVFAIANEDLSRSTEDKTSAVHFLRFELDDAMAAALKAGTALGAGIDHPNLEVVVEAVADATRDALTADLA